MYTQRESWAWKRGLGSVLEGMDDWLGSMEEGIGDWLGSVLEWVGG